MSDNSQPPVPEVTLLEIGPIFIGGLLSWMLLGISTVQLYIYHVSFPHDHVFIQAVVYIIYCLDIFQSIVSASEGWQMLITGWGRPINLEYPGWTFTALPIVSTLISVGVQAFYAWRIWRLSAWRVVPIVIIFASLAQAAGAWALALIFLSSQTIASLHGIVNYALCVVWLSCGAFTDISIMASMLYLLYGVKRRTKRFEKSEHTVNRLIRMTVETGSACAMAALFQLIFFIAIPQTNIHLTFALVLGKVYSNTLMTSLNSRAMKPNSHHTTFRSLGFSSDQTGTTADRTSTQAVTIQITQETDVDSGRAENKVDQSWDLEMTDVSSTTSAPDPATRGTALRIA